MQQIVTITSQGQITIPAVFRRSLGLNQYRKASVRTQDNKIIVEPVPDILEMAGLLQNKAIKGKRIEEVIKLEEMVSSKIVAKKHSL